jgi:bloom syndrome protein
LCRIEEETSARFLENECYKKYGKTGKSFYYSQVASTVRWLSTTSSLDLTNRLGTVSSSLSDDILSKAEPPTKPLLVLDQGPTKIMGEELCDSARPETSICASSCTELPAIPSFSEFVSSSRKAKDNRSNNTSQQQLPKRDPEKLEKRMRLQ